MSAAVYPPIRFEDHRPRRVDDERQSDYDGEPVRPEPQAERIEQHGTFRMIPDCVLDLGKSDATQLYGTMLRLARSKDYCTASAVDLAKLAKLSDRQVRNMVALLTEKGMIRVEQRHVDGMKLPNTYHLIAHLIENETPDTSDRNVVPNDRNDVPVSTERSSYPSERGSDHVKKHVNEKHVEILNPPVSPQGERAPEPAPKAPTASRQRFDQFWEAYPSKVGKLAALKAWEKVKPDAALTETIIAAVTAQKGSDRWQRGYIPNPSTWLNQGRWSDELPVAAPTEKKRAWNDPKAQRKVF